RVGERSVQFQRLLRDGAYHGQGLVGRQRSRKGHASHSFACSDATSPAMCSGVISSSLREEMSAAQIVFSPNLYQSRVLGECWYCAVANASTRLQNSANVGAGFFSRMPTSPFANAVRCAASICRAKRGFPCFVDSWTCSPLNTKWYQ